MHTYESDIPAPLHGTRSASACHQPLAWELDSYKSVAEKARVYSRRACHLTNHNRPDEQRTRNPLQDIECVFAEPCAHPAGEETRP